MNRFFIEKINPRDLQVILDDPEQLHHLKNVLRVKTNEKIALFDGEGNEYLVLVDEVGPKTAKLIIKEKMIFKESGAKVTVACAIPKNVKMDDIVDKLTQLGVDCIIPLETERMIVKLNNQKKIERRIRWEKIAVSAVKQSQRNRLITVKPVSKFKDVITGAKDFDLKLIPTLEGKRMALKEVFCQANKYRNIIILIGPEGDFTPSELELAVKSGFLPVNLGRGVLRVDTAAIAIVSFIKLNEAD